MRHMMSLQRPPYELCGTDPYAFTKSSHITHKLSRRLLVLWIASLTAVLEEATHAWNAWEYLVLAVYLLFLQ